MGYYFGPDAGFGADLGVDSGVVEIKGDSMLVTYEHDGAEVRVRYTITGTR